MRVRVVVSAAVAALAAVVAGCGGSSSTSGSSGPVSYHEPTQGWTTRVPAGWSSVSTGPAFVRGNPIADPTRLVLQAYPKHTPAAALDEFATFQGIAIAGADGSQTGEHVRWQRYHGTTTGTPALPVELAVAKDGANADVAALVARRTELAGLVESTFLPALESFAPGAVAQPKSVLAEAPAAPDYWPTAGWRTSTAADEGMDGAKLVALVAEIGAAKLPIDSVTVVRHGYVVLDRQFGKYAAGTLPEPFANGKLHELQSVTKSVTSTLLGMAMHDHPQSGITVDTPVLDLAAAAKYSPANVDARKRAMTIGDMLTMQSGLDWKESGYAYTTGSGNDVVAMIASPNWATYVIDRPMAAQPGTVFNYDTGTAHVLSAAVTLAARQQTAEFAAKQLFAPLGIRDYTWVSSPEGLTAGGFGLALKPSDLAKLAYLYLHHGEWDGRQIVPAAWVQQATTDRVASPREYGYLWWLDNADGYAYMGGLYGQLALVDPADDLVVAITAHVPESQDSGALTRWLVERYILPAVR